MELQRFLWQSGISGLRPFISTPKDYASRWCLEYVMWLTAASVSLLWSVLHILWTSKWILFSFSILYAQESVFNNNSSHNKINKKESSVTLFVFLYSMLKESCLEISMCMRVVQIWLVSYLNKNCFHCSSIRLKADLTTPSVLFKPAFRCLLGQTLVLHCVSICLHFPVMQCILLL